MRYNIKRLFNEIVIYERERDFLVKAVMNEREKNGYSKTWTELTSRLNSRRHTLAQVKRLIGEEVVNRWKEGKNLNSEIETVELIKE